MVYVILTAHGSRRARRAEEESEIDAATGMIMQCESMVSRIDVLRDIPGGHGAHVLFSHLLATMRLLSSQYGRYLDKNAALAAQEAERIIIDASLPWEGDAEEGARASIRMLSHQIAAIREGMLDVDDPRLRAVREAL